MSDRNRYAAKTEVPTAARRAEIERILERYNAHAFMSGFDMPRRQAWVAFAVRSGGAERQVRITMSLPDKADYATYRDSRSGARRERTATAAQSRYDQAVRQCWAALALVIKAKLEAIAAGISTFEQEFLAYLVLPDGSTVGDHVMPKVIEAYETGAVPALMPGPAQPGEGS